MKTFIQFIAEDKTASGDEQTMKECGTEEASRPESTASNEPAQKE